MLNELKQKISEFSSRGQGIGMVFGGVLLFVLSIILILNVALPQLNTGITTGTAGYNASNLSQCLTNCNGANLSGYAGASGVASSSFVIAVLAILAAAAALVFLFFRSEG